jgi:hypothetical protein
VETTHITEIPKDAGGEEPEKQGDLEGGVSRRAATAKSAVIGSPGFIWYPSKQQLRERYIKDDWFVAAVICWIGIVPFTIATLVYIPGVADLTDIPTYYYGAPLQTFLGGLLFFIATAMQMIMTQRKWYIPAPHLLLWHVYFWSAVGSVGFALGEALWYAESYYWSATLATFWGSWGWLIGSIVCWYMVMDKYP